MTYEQAHDEMQTFLKGKYEVNPVFQSQFAFFINQMSKSNAQLAYDAIFADMNVIDKSIPFCTKIHSF